jgi:TRAP-type C4-dicarboxylate transport system substrate-binding protein
MGVRYAVHVAFAGAIAGSLVLPLRPAQAATFDVSIFHSERDALAEQFKFFAAEVDKRTQGRVQFKPHYSGALTSVVETLGAVKNGVVPVGLTAASFAAGAIPAFAYLEMMGGVPNSAQDTKKAMEAVQPVVADLLRRYGVEYIFMQPTFDLIVLCTGKHLKTPDDWRGMKVRAAGRWQSQQVAALGASPTAIDPGEQYLALQNKTVDCALSVPNLALSLKLYEVAPKITALGQAVNVSMYVMNPQAWRQISAADQAIIREVSKEATMRSVDGLHGVVAKAREDMKKLGADIYQLSEAEAKATREKTQSIVSRIAAASGDAGKAIEATLKPYW